MVNVQTHQPFVVDKDLIPSFSFPELEVLSSQKEITNRLLNLKLAMMLGNNYKQKVKIFFQDDIGSKCVETTIWMVGQNYISLKNGTIIPINRINRVGLL